MTRGVLAERLASQGLSGRRPRDPVDVAERLLAIQAQDPRGARLAIRARSRCLTVADVDRALSEDRSVVITWLNRGTLHLVRSEDYPWLHALTAPRQLTSIATRLRQDGVGKREAERAVAVIEAALAAEGPLTRIELRERLDQAGVPTGGQALVHLLGLAGLRGVAVRGPMRGKQHAFALVRDWLGESPVVDRDSALAELARRYLAGHGPAGDRDLAKWAGLPLRDVRAGLAAISSEIEEAGEGLWRLPGRRSGGRMPPPRLLGAFDPTLVGWDGRAEIVGENAERVVSGGLFRPFALVGGRAVAGWRWVDGEVELDRWRALSRREEAALAREVDDVRRFMALA